MTNKNKWLDMAKEYADKLERAIQKLPEKYPQLKEGCHYFSEIKEIIQQSGISPDKYATFEKALDVLVLGAEIDLERGDKSHIKSRYGCLEEISRILSSPPPQFSEGNEYYLISIFEHNTLLNDWCDSWIDQLGYGSLKDLSALVHNHLSQIGQKKRADKFRDIFVSTPDSLHKINSKEELKSSDSSKKFAKMIKEGDLLNKTEREIYSLIDSCNEISLLNWTEMYEHLKAQNDDATTFLKGVMDFSKERGFYETGYIAAGLLGDEERKSSFLQLAKERSNANLKEEAAKFLKGEDPNFYTSCCISSRIGKFFEVPLDSPEKNKYLSVLFEEDFFKEQFKKKILNWENFHEMPKYMAVMKSFDGSEGIEYCLCLFSLHNFGHSCYSFLRKKIYILF